MRKFEVCKGYDANDIQMPRRATKRSAGYDLFAATEVTVLPFWKKLKSCLREKEQDFSNKLPFADILKKISAAMRPTIVRTGVKCVLPDDEYLMVANRSSNPLKRFLVLCNGVGIIDSDYYGNEGNDGEICLMFWNFGVLNYRIKKGDAIGQAIFHKFLITDDDEPLEVTRSGGFGSTTPEQ